MLFAICQDPIPDKKIGRNRKQKDTYKITPEVHEESDPLD
jgi:hypothetical protein